MLRGKAFIEEVRALNQITSWKHSGGDVEVMRLWCWWLSTNNIFFFTSGRLEVKLIKAVFICYIFICLSQRKNPKSNGVPLFWFCLFIWMRNPVWCRLPGYPTKICRSSSQCQSYLTDLFVCLCLWGCVLCGLSYDPFLCTRKLAPACDGHMLEQRKTTLSRTNTSFKSRTNGTC